MTTIIDPLGTPSIVYNKSGTVLITFTAVRQAGSPPAADPIPYVTGHTIAYLEADDNGIGTPWVELPTGADIGDVCEVYLKQSMTGTELIVVPPSGENLGGNSNISNSNGGFFRKVEASVWKRVQV